MENRESLALYLKSRGYSVGLWKISLGEDEYKDAPYSVYLIDESSGYKVAEVFGVTKNEAELNAKAILNGLKAVKAMKEFV